MMLTTNYRNPRIHTPYYNQHFNNSNSNSNNNNNNNNNITTTTIDIDSQHNSAALSSSPLSAHSLVSQYSAYQPSTYDTISALNEIPIKFQHQSPSATNNTSDHQVPDLMPSESWLLSQHTPKSAHRLGHQRESSLSSLGSNGPASPFTTSISNPQIAVTDSSSDSFHDLQANDVNSYYQLAKSMPVNDTFYTQLHNNYSNHPPQNMEMPHLGGGSDFATDGLPNMVAQQKQHKADRGLLPAPDLSVASSRSVASSVGGDSPATPTLQEPEDDRRRKIAYHSVPKLDRTMTDIYSDELYNPNFSMATTSPSQQSHVAISPSNEVFAQRLLAANSQHLSATHSPVSATSRGRSPFRQGSPFAPASNDFGQNTSGTHTGQVRMPSAQQMRERIKLEQDQKALLDQVAHTNPAPQDQVATISPKDAVLEFPESDGDSNFPLFSSQDSTTFDLDQLNKAVSQQNGQTYHQQLPITASQSDFNFSMPSNVVPIQQQLPAQYPFIPRQRQHQPTPSITSFSRVSSTDSNGTDGSDKSFSRKPAGTAADGGTYTCTYHGCTQRFETPALLQKHKREGHRQTQGLTMARASPASMTSSAILNSQAGPHRCDRINPSTGKSCNTVFSRPYDLTRHEDTIHNARKQKVRCNLCTEEKTFSRADALTRHYRVCHPDVEFPGKHRRRGGS